MTEGLNSISDLLRLYRIKEMFYLRVADKPADPDFVQAVVELYSKYLRISSPTDLSSIPKFVQARHSGHFRAGRLGRYAEKGSNLQRQLYAILYTLRQSERENSTIMSRVTYCNQLISRNASLTCLRHLKRIDSKIAEMIKRLNCLRLWHPITKAIRTQSQQEFLLPVSGSLRMIDSWSGATVSIQHFSGSLPAPDGESLCYHDP